MTEKNKTILEMDKKEVVSMVKQLFDGDLENLPEEFNEIDPLLFYTEVIREKNKRGYHEKIVIPCNYMVDKSEAVLNKVNQSKDLINGKQFEELWECFFISLDISVWGSDNWAPRILPNGALLFRNHHLVISLSETIKGEINIKHTHLRRELLKIEAYSKENSEKYDVSSFGIIHRDEQGIDWTDVVPNSLSEVGQTIIFVKKELIEEMLSKGIFNTQYTDSMQRVVNVATLSRSGHCVLRVFGSKAYLYSTERVGDEYDTILENYSYYLGEDPEHHETVIKETSSDYDFIKKYIQKEIEITKECDLLNTNFIKENRIIRVLVKDKIHEEYASKKTEQISCFEPLFGKYYDRPASYLNSNTEFWNVAQLHKGHMFIINLIYSHLPAVKDSVGDFKKYIEKAISQVSNAKVKIHLPLEGLNYINESDIFEYGTPLCEERIKKVFKKLSKKQADTITFEESAKYENEEQAEQEFLAMAGTEYKFTILFETSSIPNVADCHDYGINISKVLDASIVVHIPNYGFNQGYYSGNLDTGNWSHFIR